MYPNKYIENSPLFYLDRVQTPLLLVHGAEDSVVPSFLADEIFVGLRRAGKEVEYAKYEGEGHWEGAWGHINQVDYLNRIIDWFDKHLKAPVENPRKQTLPSKQGNNPL
jgi:dipeptidyl aminopeptidase/acylaminoacyl peptidase